MAQGFKFSQQDESERLENEARQSRIAEQLSTPCRASIKDKKIMVVIGEQQSNGYIAAQQQNYGPHFQAINNRLRALGLKTYTPEEIRRQIAQAEIEAYFRNDPDAAMAASRKLGASFVLRGLITAQSGMNPMMAREPGFGEHGFHLVWRQRPRGCRRPCEFEFLFRRRCAAHGIDPGERKGGRSRCAAVLRTIARNAGLPADPRPASK